MKALSNSFKQGFPMQLLYADDLVLVAESEEIFWNVDSKIDGKC